MSFCGEVVEVCNLPKYVNKKEIFRALFSEWQEKNTAVREVLEGKTTFEKLVTPVVEENLRIRFPYYKKGYCESPEFQKAAEKMKDVLWLGGIRSRGKGIGWIELATPVRFLWFQVYLLLANFLIVPAVVTLFSYKVGMPVVPTFTGALVCTTVLNTLLLFVSFLSEISHYSDRRDVAREVLEKAKSLDLVVGEVLKM